MAFSVCHGVDGAPRAARIVVSSSQLSALSFQLSVTSYQWSVACSLLRAPFGAGQGVTRPADRQKNRGATAAVVAASAMRLEYHRNDPCLRVRRRSSFTLFCGAQRNCADFLCCNLLSGKWLWAFLGGGRFCAKRGKSGDLRRVGALFEWS